MSQEENIKIDDEFMAGWNSYSADKTLAVIADKAVWIDVGMPQPMRDKSSMRSYIQSWFTAFPDMKAVATNRVVSDDQVAVEVEFTGTNSGPLKMSANAPAIPATNKKIVGKGVYFLRIQDGKAIEIRTFPDTAGMMMQLSLMPK